VRSDEVPKHVSAFFNEHVASLDELGMLVMLMTSPSKWWNANAAAREVGLPEGPVRRMLDRFASHNLLDIRISDDVRYQFRPGTADLETRAAAAYAFYREHPAVVLQWARMLRRSTIMDFADAFRWRR
jgi:hypothetical protein